MAARARVVTVDGIDIPVADLADIVNSKRLANRPKDQLVLPQLDHALAQRDKTQNPPDAAPTGRDTTGRPEKRTRRRNNDLGL